MNARSPPDRESGTWMERENRGFAVMALTRSGAGGTTLDRNLHVGVGPAALESATAVAGGIISDHLENVFPGIAEGGGGGSFAGECRAFRSLEFGLFDLRALLFEGHRTGSAEHAPADGDGGSPAAASGGRCGTGIRVMRH